MLCCHRGMVGKGLERQRSYPAIAGLSPPPRHGDSSVE